nr:uncharacterized protein LOC127326084 [Lolium perenne]
MPPPAAGAHRRSLPCNQHAPQLAKPLLLAWIPTNHRCKSPAPLCSILAGLLDPHARACARSSLSRLSFHRASAPAARPPHSARLQLHHRPPHASAADLPPTSPRPPWFPRPTAPPSRSCSCAPLAVPTAPPAATSCSGRAQQAP